MFYKYLLKKRKTVQTSICVALIVSVLPKTAGTDAQLHPHGVSPRPSLFLPMLPFFYHFAYPLEFQSFEDFGSMSSIPPSVKVCKPFNVFPEKLLLGSGNTYTETSGTTQIPGCGQMVADSDHCQYKHSLMYAFWKVNLHYILETKKYIPNSENLV